MANKSKRDKCFEEAANAYNEMMPDAHKINIQHQKPWIIDATTGKWRPITATENLWNFITGGDPFRVPDWTLPDVDGGPLAGDNKFKGDSFKKRISPRTGNTQDEDLKQMNVDNHPGKPQYHKAFSLDPEKCGCDDNPQPQDVYETQGTYFMPHPGVGGRVMPGEMPGTGGGPQWLEVSPPTAPVEATPFRVPGVKVPEIIP